MIRRAGVPSGGSLLDLGTGTGDLAMEAGRQSPDSRSIAADFTLEMMQVGQGRPGGNLLRWSAADTLNLPFADGTFDAVVSGFLMRNVANIARALGEPLPVGKNAIWSTKNGSLTRNVKSAPKSFMFAGLHGHRSKKSSRPKS